PLESPLVSISLSRCSRAFGGTRPTPPQPYTLSLHDALPISARGRASRPRPRRGRPAPCAPAGPRAGERRSPAQTRCRRARGGALDRKSTRLNSSHVKISYAVFCLKKKKKNTNIHDLKSHNPK